MKRLSFFALFFFMPCRQWLPWFWLPTPGIGYFGYWERERTRKQEKINVSFLTNISKKFIVSLHVVWYESVLAWCYRWSHLPISSYNSQDQSVIRRWQAFPCACRSWTLPCAGRFCPFSLEQLAWSSAGLLLSAFQNSTQGRHTCWRAPAHRRKPIWVLHLYRITPFDFSLGAVFWRSLVYNGVCLHLVRCEVPWKAS